MLIIRTAEMNYALKDYIIRVKGMISNIYTNACTLNVWLANDILTRLDPENLNHRELALLILSTLLSSHQDSSLYASFFKSYKIRQQIRLWCSIHLLIHHIHHSEARRWAQMFLDGLEVEVDHLTRLYIEVRNSF